MVFNILAVAISLMISFPAAPLKLKIWNLQPCYLSEFNFTIVDHDVISNFLSTHFQIHHLIGDIVEKLYSIPPVLTNLNLSPYLPCLRPQPLISVPGQQPSKWTMPHIFKRGMKNMAMSVWMARTVPVSSAVLKIAEQEPGDMGGYIFALPKWTPMLGSSSPPPSVCSIWFTGSPIFICKEVWVSLIGVLFSESHGKTMSFLSLMK